MGTFLDVVCLFAGGVLVPVLLLDLIVICKGIEHAGTNSQVFPFIIQLDGLYVLATAQGLAAEPVLVGHDLVHEREILPVGREAGIEPPVGIVVPVMVAVADEMIQATTEGELEDIGNWSEAELRHWGNALPVLLVVPGLDDLVAFHELLIHDGVGFIIVGDAEVGVEKSLRPFAVERTAVVQVGIEVRVASLDLKGVDLLLDRAQVAQRGHLVADGRPQAQVTPVGEGIFQGQPGIERIILVKVDVPFLAIERASATDSRHIVQLAAFSLELRVKIGLSLLHLGVIIVPVDVIVVREGVRMAQARSPAIAVRQFLFVDTFANQGIFLAIDLVANVCQHLVALALLVDPVREALVVSADHVQY